jgi:hypothetical protein
MKLKEKRTLTINSELSAWFLEAFLWGRNASMLSINAINQSPVLFPFSIDFHINDVSHNPRLSIFRQNVDNDMVMLKKNSSDADR